MPSGRSGRPAESRQAVEKGFPTALQTHVRLVNSLGVYHACEEHPSHEGAQRDEHPGQHSPEAERTRSSDRHQDDAKNDAGPGEPHRAAMSLLVLAAQSGCHDGPAPHHEDDDAKDNDVEQQQCIEAGVVPVDIPGFRRRGRGRVALHTTWGQLRVRNGDEHVAIAPEQRPRAIQPGRRVPRIQGRR